MKKKIITALSIVVLGVSCFSGVAYAQSYTEYTNEFGTFRAHLYQSGNQVYAITSTTKSASRLFVNVEIQYNSTGKRIDYDENVDYNTTNVSSRVTNYTNATLACFSCHEARGQSSVVKYFAETF